MFDFEKLSLKQLSVLSNVISQIQILNKNIIEQKYNRYSINFKDTLSFLYGIRLINYKDKKIVLKKIYQDFLILYKLSGYDDKILRDFFIKEFVFKENFLADYIDNFLSNFIYDNSTYKFKVKSPQKILYSGIRNFLSELGFLKIDLEHGIYTISQQFFETYRKKSYKKKLTLAKLKNIIKEKEQLGYDAELIIIDFEKKKLSKLKFLLQKIEHISQYDVNAGYDIKSYKDKLDDNLKPIPIFIEVKAVPFWNYEFNWTKNEINKAKILKEKYYLYLLPVLSRKNFDIENLKIIEDPYHNIYENRKEWFCSEEILSFSLNI